MPIFRVKSVKIYTGKKNLHGHRPCVRDKYEVCSFPTHDLKFGQFCDSKKNFGPPKFCWNFSEIFRFFFRAILKKILFSGVAFHGKFWLMIMTFGNFPHTLGI